MELLAEAERVGLALVEAGGHDPAGVGGGADRLVQRRVRAGQLQADVGAPAVGGLAQHGGGGGRRGVHSGSRAVPGGVLQPAGHRVDGHHPGPGEHGEPGGEQPDDALAEDADPVAEVQVTGEHGGQRDGAGAGEDRGERVQPGGERADRVGGEHGLGPVPPDAPDELPRVPVGDVRRDLDDLTDLFVAEADQRVGHRGLSGDEHPGGVVPVLAEPGIAAPVEGQLGAGGDARVAGADPDLAGAERIRRAGLEADPSRPGERDHPVAHVSHPGSTGLQDSTKIAICLAIDQSKVLNPACTLREECHRCQHLRGGYSPPP